MSLGQALSNDIGRMMSMMLAMAIVAFLAAFCGGWYCGDRLDMPTIYIGWSE